MIFPLVFFGTSLFFGYQLLKRIAFRLSHEETVVSGFIIGVVINGFLNYLLAHIFGVNLTPVIISQTFLFITSLILLIWQRGFSLESDLKIKNYIVADCLLAL